MRSQAKRQSESYPVVLSDPLEIREEGKINKTENKADKSPKRLERRKRKSKNVFKTTLSHASNISKTFHRESEIEKTKLPENTNLASMDVISLCTNIPQEESITTVCKAYEEFYHENPLISTSYLREGLPDSTRHLAGGTQRRFSLKCF